MERKRYLMMLGDIILKERKKRNMNQIEFYEFLFPGNGLESENIKKKMNSIENGKAVNVKYELLFALHDKCELSMDYLFGYETVYPTYDSRYACEYTGLSVKTIQILHKCAMSIQTHVPELTPEMKQEAFVERCTILDKKKEAEWILKITDLLFDEGNGSKKKHSFSNLRILHDLYMMSVAVPTKISGIPEELVDENDDIFSRVDKSKTLVCDSLSMTDSFGSSRAINIQEIHQRIWRENLMKDLELFADRIRKIIRNESSVIEEQ